MAKNVLTLRVSDEKKEEWLSRAKKAGMKLGPWIEAMCDRPDREHEAILPDEAFDKFVVDVEKPGRVIPPLSELLGRPSRLKHSLNCTCMSCRGK